MRHPCDGHTCDHCGICDELGICCCTLTAEVRSYLLEQLSQASPRALSPPGQPPVDLAALIHNEPRSSLSAIGQLLLAAGPVDRLSHIHHPNHELVPRNAS